MNQIYRPRRLRRSENIRGLVRETYLRAEEFIYPYRDGRWFTPKTAWGATKTYTQSID